MATFVSPVSFTDQGIRNVKDSPARFDAFRAAAGKLGVTVKSVYWTVGSCDLVVTVDGPEEAVTTLLRDNPNANQPLEAEPEAAPVGTE